jgi:hypothetical protein
METSSLRTLNIIAKKPQRNCTFMNSASGDEAGAISYKRLEKASEIFAAQKVSCNVMRFNALIILLRIPSATMFKCAFRQVLDFQINKIE